MCGAFSASSVGTPLRGGLSFLICSENIGIASDVPGMGGLEEDIANGLCAEQCFERLCFVVDCLSFEWLMMID